MGKHDINKHTRRIFPWFWQTVENIALADVLVSAFDNVNTLLEEQETDFRQRAGYSIQRLSLENSLNDRFDSTQRRITVGNSSNTASNYVFNESETIADNLEIYVFNESESLPSGANETYFFNESESASIALSPFTVTAPLVLESRENEIRAWVEAVQMSGTLYELIFI